jgi:hypothetical protein
MVIMHDDIDKCVHMRMRTIAIDIDMIAKFFLLHLAKLYSEATEKLNGPHCRLKYWALVELGASYARACSIIIFCVHLRLFSYTLH